MIFTKFGEIVTWGETTSSDFASLSHLPQRGRFGHALSPPSPLGEGVAAATDEVVLFNQHAELVC